jgi:hypothetical protein
MPVYTLKDTKTQEEWDVNMSYDELQKVLDEMVDVIRVMKPNQFITIHGSTMSRTDTDFRSHLKAIKKKYPGNTIDNY